MLARVVNRDKLLGVLYRIGQERFTGGLFLHSKHSTQALCVRNGKWLAGNLSAIHSSGFYILEKDNGYRLSGIHKPGLDLVAGIEESLWHLSRATSHCDGQPSPEVADFEGRLALAARQINWNDPMISTREKRVAHCLRKLSLWEPCEDRVDVLGLSSNADELSRKARYREVISIAHPDAKRLREEAALQMCQLASATKADVAYL